MAMFRAKRIVGWRRHRMFLKPGGGLRYTRPDFTFPIARLVVMVDGCFWHGCPTCYKRPKTNRGYWEPKLSANVKRDATATTVLKRAGWRVFRIWEHQLNARDPKTRGQIGHILSRIKRATNRIPHK